MFPSQPPCLSLSPGLPVFPSRQLLPALAPPATLLTLLLLNASPVFPALPGGLLPNSLQRWLGMKPPCTPDPFLHCPHPLVRTDTLLGKSHAFLLNILPIPLSKGHLRPHPGDPPPTPSSSGPAVDS